MKFVKYGFVFLIIIFKDLFRQLQKGQRKICICWVTPQIVVKVRAELKTPPSFACGYIFQEFGSSSMTFPGYKQRVGREVEWLGHGPMPI